MYLRRTNSVLKAFSLVEMLIVVVIIGILVTVAVPMFAGLKRQGNEKRVKTNLRALLAAVEMYGYQNDNLPTQAQYNCNELCARYGAPDETFNPSSNERYIFTGHGMDYDDYLALKGTTVMFGYNDDRGQRRFNITRSGQFN